VRDVSLVWNVEGDIAESPVWDAGARRVLFAHVHSGRILGYQIEDGARKEWSLNDRVGSFGLCQSGRFIVALRRRIVLFDPSSGSVEPLISEIDEPKGNCFNDGRPGPDGSYWVGTIDGRILTPGLDRRSIVDPTGSLYRISPDGSIEIRATGYIVSNGLAFSPDGLTLYATKHVDDEPVNRAVEAWDFDPATGRTSSHRVQFLIDFKDGLPDGAAIDVNGCYWSAGISSGCINQFSPSGELLTKVPLPFRSPTMPCFAESSLFVTSLSRRDGQDYRGSSHLPGNIAGLFRMDAPATGAPVGVFADS
jgi:sugar lactone lactonase YvrE